MKPQAPPAEPVAGWLPAGLGPRGGKHWKKGGREYTGKIPPGTSPDSKAFLEYLQQQTGGNGEGAAQYAKDAQGHEHKGKGEGGGQFTSGGDGDDGGDGKGKVVAKKSEFRKRSEKAEKRTGALSEEELRADIKGVSLTPEQDQLVNFFYGCVGDDLRAMPERDRLSHGHAMHSVASKLPKKAIKRINQYVSSLHVTATWQPVTEEFEKRSGFHPKKSNVVLGFYDTRDGSLWSDGGEFVDVEDSRRGVLSHELGHGIDGPKFELTDSEEWQRAYQAEIEGKQLSDYGATEPREGFAEFCRAAYGSDVEGKEIERLFPLCTAFFKKRGLL